MSHLLNSLNDKQKEAVTHDRGPLLIIAGAGTGKTTVITTKIAYLILEKNISPEEILALTFTDKAAGEMEERVDRLLPLGYHDLWISTFHAFAERILHEHGLEIGLPNDFKLLNATEQWLSVRRNLDLFNLDYYRPLGNPTKFIHALLKLFSRAKDECISPEQYLEYAQNLKLDSDSAEFVRDALSEEEIKKLSKKKLKELAAEGIKKQLEIADAYHTYQRLLLENNALDFGDLINYTLKLFQTRKNLLLKYQQQFKYILVDEFQDTNYAQYELVKLLSGPPAGGQNLTVVGDDDQAIYKFRGASVSNILQFKDDFPKCREIFLVDNYRSAQPILDLAYKFIQRNNPDRLEIKLAGDKKLSKKLISHVERHSEILHLHGQTLDDEAELVISKIVSLYNKDKDNNWSDFAILVRANASSDDFCRALEAAKVPYIFLAASGLYRKSIILDILSWLRCLDDYHESAAFYRVLNLPIWHISERDIVNLNYWANRKGLSLYESAREANLFNNISAETKKKLQGILSLMADQAALARTGKKPTEIITDFLNRSGYLKYLTNEDFAASREQLDYLNQFYKKLAAFEQENVGHTLKDLLELWELEREAGDEGALSFNWEEAGPDAVKIMTVHGAKGLEFKYVFIANLVDKKFPSTGKSDPIELPDKLIKEIIPEGDAHLEEERRLFYVAVTRAKSGLYFSSAEDYGGVRKKKLSRFLAELAEDGFVLGVKPTVVSRPLLGGAATSARPSQAEREYLKPSASQNFSFTQLRDYERCPYQYRFAHVLHIPAAGKAVFSFGKTMHGVMQKFFLLARLRSSSGQKDLFGGEAKSGEIIFDELRDIYVESFIDDWYPDKKTKDAYFDQGLKSLKNFFDLWQKCKSLAEQLEYRFTFKLSSDCSIRGAIDRIDRVSGGVKLIDYKTGRAKERLSGEDKEQLLLYQIAAQEVLKEPVKELVFYYFDDNSEISFLGTPEEISGLKEKIISTVEEIKTAKFPAKPEKEKCKWCDFRNICDYAL